MSPIRRTGPTKTQPENSGYITGVAIGLVTQNKDDEGQCRVQVSYPWHEKPLESYWARLAMPMAGNERGLVLIPEVGDEVLVAFESGDLRFFRICWAVCGTAKTGLPIQTTMAKTTSVAFVQERSIICCSTTAILESSS